MFGFVFLTIVAPTTINHSLVCKLHLSSPKKFYFSTQTCQTTSPNSPNLGACGPQQHTWLSVRPKQSINMINVTYVKQITVQSNETLEARGTLLSGF